MPLFALGIYFAGVVTGVLLVPVVIAGTVIRSYLRRP